MTGVGVRVASLARVAGRAGVPARGKGAIGAARPVPVPLAVSALAVAAVLLVPPAYLVLRAAAADQAWQWLAHPRIGQLVRASLLLALAVTGSAVALSVPLAWLLSRTDLPGRGLWLAALALPLAMPSYVGAFALIAAVQPGGPLPSLIGLVGGPVRLPRLEGFWGAWLTLTLFTYPYVLLPLRAAWARLDRSLEEAARALGLGPAETFRRVTLPHLGPALASGALLAALYVLSDFGAVSLLRYDTLTLAIYLQYGASFDRSRAAVLALVLLALTMGLHRLHLAGRGRVGGVLFRLQPGAPRPAQPVRLGGLRWPAAVGCGLVAMAAVGLPGVSLVFWLVEGLRHGQGGEPLAALPALGAAAAGSVVVAALAAGATILAALPLAWVAVRHPGRLARGVERLTYLSFGLPGIVVALSLVFFGVRFLGPLYPTLGLLVAAHVVHFLPEAMGPEMAAVARLNPHLEEVARSLGRPPIEVFRRVTLPLLRPGLVVGASLVFLTSIKELPATLLLSPIGFRTLATLTWLNAAEGFFAQAALPGLILLLVSGVSVGLLLRHQQDGEGLW